MKICYPYIANDNKYKFFIITNIGKRIYFGAIGYQHYTEGHLDEARRQAYVRRHQSREDWNNPNTPVIGLIDIYGCIQHINRLIMK